MHSLLLYIAKGRIGALSHWQRVQYLKHDVVPSHEMSQHVSPWQLWVQHLRFFSKLMLHTYASFCQRFMLMLTTLICYSICTLCRHRLQTSSWGSFDAFSSTDRRPVAHGYDLRQNQAAHVLGVAAPTGCKRLEQHNTHRPMLHMAQHTTGGTAYIFC